MQTMRSGGKSKGTHHSFNLATHVNDDINTVNFNRALLNQYLPKAPFWLNQTHSNDIVELPSSKLNADACFTKEKNIVCVVQTADCLPVLVTNKKGTIVAAIHAGWRGLLNGVIEKTLYKMNLPANELLVWLGPAISQNYFEVGNEVKNSFCEKHHEAKKAFQSALNQKWLANIYMLAKIRLHVFGVTHIYGGSITNDYCTYASQKDFFSFRRDGETGRMASLIWISP
jgi:YfiH family protein